MTRDKNGQALLGDFLQAYGATPILTEGNLPGGGALFETCTRAAESVPEQTELPAGDGPRVLIVGERVRIKAKPGSSKSGRLVEVRMFSETTPGRVLVRCRTSVYTGGERCWEEWIDSERLEPLDQESGTREAPKAEPQAGLFDE
jgi:hypothetical protein